VKWNSISSRNRENNITRPTGFPSRTKYFCHSVKNVVITSVYNIYTEDIHANLKASLRGDSTRARMTEKFQFLGTGQKAYLYFRDSMTYLEDRMLPADFSTCSFSRADLLRRFATDFRYETKAGEPQARKCVFRQRQRREDPGLFRLSKP
jgi:hypothetical protein